MSPSSSPLALLLGSTLLLSACSREDLYGGQTFTQTVAQAYADCNDGEIRFLASKQGIQTAFAECGSNKFAHKAWSPDGRYLYFQLTHGGYIMDGETKDLVTVPTETPVEGAAWLSADRLAVPLAPPEGATTPYNRVVVYNRAANTLDELQMQLSEVRDLQPGPDGGLLLTGLDASGKRSAWSFDAATGVPAPVLPWLPDAPTQLSVSYDAGLVGVATEAGGALYRLDGTLVMNLPDAKRVIPHPEGRYVALEVDGDPVSPFDMRAWDELSEEARQRELARQKKWLEKQPDYVQKEIIPPELQIVDLDNGGRYRVTFVWGERFEWYRARNYFGSFMLFGIEGKQLNRNVALTNFHERLRMLGKGETPLGMEVIDAPRRTDAAEGEAAPDPQE